MAADYESLRQNLVYARMALLDSLKRSESPIASHLLITQVFDESPSFREAGIAAGLAWQSQADLVAFYTDLGWSSGMERAMARCRELNLPTVGRTLFPAGVDVRGELAKMELGGWPALEALRNG
jgi:hypothetical protein